jgi:hypothetical protein
LNGPQFIRREVTTSAGIIPLWSLPEAFASTTKPIVLVIAGVFSTIDALTNLPQAIGLLADA